jgi:hypothetical protein
LAAITPVVLVAVKCGMFWRAIFSGIYWLFRAAREACFDCNICVFRLACWLLLISYCFALSANRCITEKMPRLSWVLVLF